MLRPSQRFDQDVHNEIFSGAAPCDEKELNEVLQEEYGINQAITDQSPCKQGKETELVARSS